MNTDAKNKNKNKNSNIILANRVQQCKKLHNTST